MAKVETAAEAYRRVAAGQAEIVDVTVPSGFVFKFEKPSKFALLFGIGQLPTTAASEAVEAWQKDGIVDESAPQAQNINAAAKSVFDVRDRVLDLSYSPKIVVGAANESAGEISTDHIKDADLEYLFKWVASGGGASFGLGTFPQGSQPGPVAQPNRKARRAAAK